MGSLTKFLNTQTHRKKMREGGGGLKTPLTMKMNPHPDLDNFFVSNTKGNIVCVKNGDKGVPSNFFELDLDKEDEFHVKLVDSIFVEGVKKEWGNVALMDSITQNEIDDIIEYFLEYDLEMSRVFCSYKGYKYLQKTGMLVHPSGNGGVSECPPLKHLKMWEEEYIVVGMLEERPLFLNEQLGPYIVFSAPPTFVGMLTRIDNNISIFVHNAERGVVVVRLSEDTLNSEEVENDDESDGLNDV